MERRGQSTFRAPQIGSGSSSSLLLLLVLLLEKLFLEEELLETMDEEVEGLVGSPALLLVMVLLVRLEDCVVVRRLLEDDATFMWSSKGLVDWFIFCSVVLDW